MYKTEFHETISCVGKNLSTPPCYLLLLIPNTGLHIMEKGYQTIILLESVLCYSTLRLSISPIVLKTV